MACACGCNVTTLVHSWPVMQIACMCGCTTTTNSVNIIIDWYNWAYTAQQWCILIMLTLHHHVKLSISQLCTAVCNLATTRSIDVRWIMPLVGWYRCVRGLHVCKCGLCMWITTQLIRTTLTHICQCARCECYDDGEMVCVLYPTCKPHNGNGGVACVVPIACISIHIPPYMSLMWMAIVWMHT